MSATPLHPLRRQGRPSRSEADALDRHVLDVAERLFLRDGFEATSVDAIAAEAGASKRTLYHRHPSKAKLFEAVVVRALDPRLGEFAYNIKGATIERRLERLALALIDLALAAPLPDLMRIVIPEIRRFPDLVVLLESSIRRKVIASIIETGELDPLFGPRRRTAQVEAAAIHLLGMTGSEMLLRTLMGAHPEQLRQEAPAFVRASIRVFLHGYLTPER